MDDLKEKIGDYFGIVIRSRIVLERNILSRAGNLKFIARSGSGLENIDVQAAKDLGINCFNSLKATATPSVNTPWPCCCP